MSALFDEAMRFVLSVEGGRVDDARDQGGRTAFGITQKAYRAWKHDGTLDVFDITDADVRAFYADLWESLGVEELPREVAVVHFDSAVHSGSARAITWLRCSTWADVPATAQAFAYLSLRRRFLDQQGPTFHAGFMNRIDALRKAIGL